MAGAVDAKGGKMTVFKTDRQEDYASMIMVALVTVSVLIYMSFLVGKINLKAPDNGKVMAVAVAAEGLVKRGDKLLTMEVTEKKMVGGQLQEKVATKDIKSTLDGKVLSLKAKPGDAVKKGKDVLMVLEPEKGQLP